MAFLFYGTRITSGRVSISETIDFVTRHCLSASSKSFLQSSVSEPSGTSSVGLMMTLLNIKPSFVLSKRASTSTLILFHLSFLTLERNLKVRIKQLEIEALKKSSGVQFPSGPPNWVGAEAVMESLPLSSTLKREVSVELEVVLYV